MKAKHFLLIILPLMLIAGLRPKGYDPVNYAYWEQGGGLAFTSRSLAHTEKGIPLPPSDSDFVLTMEIAPDYPPEPALQILFLLFGDSPWDQLSVALYDHTLIVLNGWDYSDRWKKPKMYIPLEDREGIITVRIESGSGGTFAYINNALLRSDSELALDFPSNRRETRLVLGSDIGGENNWSGTFYGLSLADGQGGLFFDYDLCTRDTSEGFPLLVPERRPVLIKRFLQRPRTWQLRMGVLQMDMIVNLIGFIPLGALLYLLLKDRINWAFLPAVLLSFLFSLFLESVQVWIPTRDSSLLDLALNSTGGLIGTIGTQTVLKIKKKRLF